MTYTQTRPATTPQRSAPAQPARLAAWTALLHAESATVAAVARDLEREVGIPLEFHQVLFHLGHEPNGSSRMQDLARATLLSKSGLTRLIDRMVHAGLVRRTVYEDDRRGTLAVLTAKGRQLLQRSTPVFLRSVGTNFSSYLSDREVRELRRILRKLLAANGHADDPICSGAEGDVEPSGTLEITLP